MINIKKVLLPVDFSKLSKAALPYAVDFARKYNSDLYILHVYDENTLDPYYFGNKNHSQEFYAHLQVVFQDRIDEYLKDSDLEDINVFPILANGIPFVEIIKCAKNENVDLVVITTHGRTGLSHMLLGSTAEKIIRKSSKPVFVVKQPGFEFKMP